MVSTTSWAMVIVIPIFIVISTTPGFGGVMRSSVGTVDTTVWTVGTTFWAVPALCVPRIRRVCHHSCGSVGERWRRGRGQAAQRRRPR